MPAWTHALVRLIDQLNYRVGRFAMYLLFALMGVLLWSAVTKAAGQPAQWTLEMAQFVMVGYYILGGAYAMQMGGHVRMDLFYARWSPGTRAVVDALTILAVMIYLAVMIWGAVDSTVYSFAYNERSPTAWRPYLWPIKVVMVVGFTLVLLQCIAQLIRDIAALRGQDMP